MNQTQRTIDRLQGERDRAIARRITEGDKADRLLARVIDERDSALAYIRSQRSTVARLINDRDDLDLRLSNALADCERLESAGDAVITAMNATISRLRKERNALCEEANASRRALEKHAATLAEERAARDAAMRDAQRFDSLRAIEVRENEKLRARLVEVDGDFDPEADDYPGTPGHPGYDSYGDQISAERGI